MARVANAVSVVPFTTEYQWALEWDLPVTEWSQIWRPMEALTYVCLSLPTRSFVFTCIVKIAQGDWNRRNLEPPSELYKDRNDTSIRLAVWLGEAKLIWPLGAAMYGKNTRVLWCFIVKEDWGWPACQPPQRLQNSACRYRSSLFRVHWSLHVRHIWLHFLPGRWPEDLTPYIYICGAHCWIPS